MKRLLPMLFLIISAGFAWVENDESECLIGGYEWINNAHVNATYSFTNTANGTRNPTGWFTTEVLPYRYGYTIDEAGGRGKVQLLFDNDTNPEIDTLFLSTNDFPVDKGNWSFWFRMHDPANENGAPNVFGIAEIASDSTQGASPVLVFGNASLGAINITSQLACAESLGAGMTLIGSIVKDKWHYVNVEFDNTSSTFLVTLDNNSPVTCSLYDSWGPTGATGVIFTTGAVIPSGSPDHYIWIDAVNFDWATISHDTSIAQCCGNDLTADETFYNGTYGVNATYCTNGLLSYEFLIKSINYDKFVSLSSENASVTANILSNTSPSNILRINLSNTYGPTLLNQSFNCQDNGGNNYTCLWTMPVTDWPCLNHEAVIYAEGKTAQENFNFSVDDIISVYSVPQDKFITTNQLLGASFTYCSGRTDYNQINVKASINSQLIINQNSSPTGNNLISYTSPAIAGYYELAITANDTNYWKTTTLPINVVKSLIKINPPTKVFKKDTPGYRSAYVEIINPSSEKNYYSISILPFELNMKHSDNKAQTINLTIEPYSRAVNYFDVFPLIAGNYKAQIQVNTSIPADNETLEFNAVVQSIYQRGLFIYTLTPDTNPAALILLLALVSFFIINNSNLLK